MDQRKASKGKIRKHFPRLRSSHWRGHRCKFQEVDADSFPALIRLAQQNCPDFTLEELKETIEISAKAFESWRHSTPLARKDVLQRWKALCLEHEEDLALLITVEVRGTNWSRWRSLLY